MKSATRRTQPRRPKPEGKPLHVSHETLEAIRWLALALMTADHINKYLFDETLLGVYELGRLAMPLFAFVLAYNLARPMSLTNGAYQLTMVRLALTGTGATPFFIMLGDLLLRWWPLNILFTLLIAAGSLYLSQQGSKPHKIAGLAVLLVGGAFVEILVVWHLLLHVRSLVLPNYQPRSLVSLDHSRSLTSGNQCQPVGCSVYSADTLVNAT